MAGDINVYLDHLYYEYLGGKSSPAWHSNDDRNIDKYSASPREDNRARYPFDTPTSAIVADQFNDEGYPELTGVGVFNSIRARFSTDAKTQNESVNSFRFHRDVLLRAVCDQPLTINDVLMVSNALAFMNRVVGKEPLMVRLDERVSSAVIQSLMLRYSVTSSQQQQLLWPQLEQLIQANNPDSMALSLTRVRAFIGDVRVSANDVPIDSLIRYAAVKGSAVAQHAMAIHYYQAFAAQKAAPQKAAINARHALVWLEKINADDSDEHVAKKQEVVAFLNSLNASRAPVGDFAQRVVELKQQLRNEQQHAAFNSPQQNALRLLDDDCVITTLPFVSLYDSEDPIVTADANQPLANNSFVGISLTPAGYLYSTVGILGWLQKHHTDPTNPAAALKKEELISVDSRHVDLALINRLLNAERLLKAKIKLDVTKVSDDQLRLLLDLHPAYLVAKDEHSISRFLQCATPALVKQHNQFYQNSRSLDPEFTSPPNTNDDDPRIEQPCDSTFVH